MIHARNEYEEEICHVFTGDTSIFNNKFIQEKLTYGTKFRYSHGLNAIGLADSILDDVHKYNEKV